MGSGAPRDEAGAAPETDAASGAGGEGATAGGWLRLGLQLGLTVVVTWFILARVGLGAEDLRNLDAARWVPAWGAFVGSCAVLLLGYLVSAAFWGRMVRELGGPDLPVGTAVRTFFVANLGRYVPGKLWQIAGLALLARQKGVSPAVATTAAVLGQGAALVGASLVGSAALLGAGPVYRRVGLWSLAAVAVALAVVSLPPVLRRLIPLWFRLARRARPEDLEVGPGFALRWVLLYTLNWGIYAIAFWIFVRSFDLPGGVLDVAPAFAAAYVLGYVAVFAPAGLGVREGMLTFFLGPVLGAGSAGAVAVIARLWTTVVEVVPAGAFWVRHLALARREPRT